MSLHLFNNVKELTDEFRRTINHPQFEPGRCLSVYDVATIVAGPEFPKPAAAVSRPIWTTSRVVKWILYFF